MTSAAAYAPSSPMPLHAIKVMESAMVMTEKKPVNNPKKETTDLTTEIDEVAISSLLNAFDVVLNQLLAAIPRMKPRMAKKILQGLKKRQASIDKMRIKIASPLPRRVPKLEKQVYQLSQLLVGIFDDLEIAADDTPIDENSESYRVFLKEIVAEAESTPRTYGRKALYALLGRS